MFRSTPYSRFARGAMLFVLACSSDDASGPRATKDAGHDAGDDRDSGKSSAQSDAGGLADGIVGKSCSEDRECGTGTCQKTISVANTMYPGGYCTGPCRADGECGAHGVCVPGLRGRAGSCYLGCENDASCRDGYICRVVSGVGRCVPGAKPLPAGVVGNACTSDGDCGGTANTCAAKLGDLDATGGYCTQSCAIDGDCGEGGRCINGINVVTINSGRCYRSCGPDAPCRAEYECRSPSGADLSPGVCVPTTESDAGI